MGIFDTLFGGKTKNVTSTSTSSPPAYITQGGEDIFNAAKRAATRPYPRYDAARIAPFSKDTLSAFDMVKQAAGAAPGYQPAWKQAFKASMGATAKADTPFSAEALQTYMNPFREGVIDPTFARMDRELAADKIRREANAAERGSFGNSGNIVGDQLAVRDMNELKAMLLSQLNTQSFDTAAGLRADDANRSLDVAAMYGDLAPLIASLKYGDAAALQGVGAAKEGKAQANLDLRRKDFENQFQYPQNQLAWLESILQGSPGTTTNVTSAPQQQPNAASQVIGAILAAAGLF